MTETTTETATAKDLLYFGQDFDANARNQALLEESFVKEVKEKYPLARLRNHHAPSSGFKQGLDIPGVEQDDYYVWMISRGWANSSLSFALFTSKRKSELMERAKEEYPDAFAED